MTQLNMNVIKDENKIYEEFIEIPITVQDTEYTVKLFPFFSPIKTNQLINDVADFHKKAKEEKLDIADEEFDSILGYFIVKTFTDIKMTSSKKAKKIYEEFKIAINSKLFDVILKSIPQESIEYVYDKLYEIQGMNAQLQKRLEDFQKQVKDMPLENRDILFPKNEKQIPEV